MLAQPIPSDGTDTFPVAGVADVPASAYAVVLDINALNPTAKGFLTVYNADSADPGVSSVGLRVGRMTNQTASVEVSSSGTVSLTNHSGGSTDVTASVVGYYTEAAASSAGDTYFGVPWASPVINTSTGWNVPQEPIPAGGSLTFQVTGTGGIATGADTAVLQVNALNASEGGYLTAYAAGSADPGVSALAYYNDTYYRNLLYIPLSSSGEATLTNHGSAPVDVSVYARGYYMPPSTTPAGGEYWPVDAPEMVYGTSSQGAQLAVGASATFQVTGTGDIPSANVAGVSEDVVVSNPTAMGRLDEDPAGGSEQPVVSFLTGDPGYAGYDNSLVSTLSPSGQETITNGSSGIIDVQVGVTGWFQAADAPSSPESVSASISGSSAAVTWAARAADGGSPVTGYTVTASPDGQSVEVGPATFQASLTGLANAQADSFSVTATNAAGTSASSGFGPSEQILSGTLLAPAPAGDANPAVPGDEIDISVFPQGTGSGPILIGTTTTNSAGQWTFTVPSFSSLPAAAQSEAAANGGVINLEADAYATATAPAGEGGGTYLETASTFEPAWVGASAQSMPPPDLGSPQPQTMTLIPPGPDNSSQDTEQAQADTWASQNNPATANGSADPAAGPPVDAYGYQSIGPDDGYSPYITYDGADLSDVVPQPFSMTGHPQCTHWYTYPFSGPEWSVLGEVHSSVDSTGGFTYTQGSQTEFGVAYSGDSGDHWGVSGGLTWTDGTSNNIIWGTIGPSDSRRPLIKEDYYEAQENFSACSPYAAFHKDWIYSEGDDTNTDVDFEWGTKDFLNGTDTAANFCPFRGAHPGWVQQYAPNTGDWWMNETGWSYSIGATVLGVAICGRRLKTDPLATPEI